MRCADGSAHRRLHNWRREAGGREAAEATEDMSRHGQACDDVCANMCPSDWNDTEECRALCSLKLACPALNETRHGACGEAVCPNECDPSKRCNVCAECCKPYVICDACVQATCPLPADCQVGNWTGWSGCSRSFALTMRLPDAATALRSKPRKARYSDVGPSILPTCSTEVRYDQLGRCFSTYTSWRG